MALGLNGLVLVGLVGLPFGGSSPAGSKPLIDIPKLINKSPDQVAAVLGKPIKVFKIKSDFNLMPGDDRYYKPAVTGQTVSVRFHRKKAVYFDVLLPNSTKDPRKALRQVGFNPTTNPYLDVATATRWRDEMNGIMWKDISVIHSGSSNVTELGYNEVMATFLQPEE